MADSRVIEARRLVQDPICRCRVMHTGTMAVHRSHEPENDTCQL